MTFLEKFKEDHQNAPLEPDDGTPYMCPFHMGYEEHKPISCIPSAWCWECWNREIPKPKTMMDVFFEAFPNAPRCTSDIPRCCPFHCGLSPVETGCSGNSDCLECWSREVEE